MGGLRTLLIDNHPALFTVASSNDPLSLLLAYGPLGIFVVLWVTEVIPSRGQVRDIRAGYEARLADQRGEIADLKATVTKQDTIIAMFMQQGQQSVQVMQRNAQVIEALPKVIPPPAPPADLEDIRQALPRLIQIAERLESLAGDGEAAP